VILMNAEQLVPSLMFMTLGAVLVIGIVVFLSFLRKRRNREAASLAFSGTKDSELPRSGETNFSHKANAPSATRQS
jgi:hypothetical protein